MLVAVEAQPPAVEPKVEAPLPVTTLAPASATAPPPVAAPEPPVVSVEETLKRKREEEASGVMYEEPAPPAPRESGNKTLHP